MEMQHAEMLFLVSNASIEFLKLLYLSTTCLWTSFQFSLSLSVPMAGFSSWRETPATLTPLQTATTTQREDISFHSTSLSKVEDYLLI